MHAAVCLLFPEPQRSENCAGKGTVGAAAAPLPGAAATAQPHRLPALPAGCGSAPPARRHPPAILGIKVSSSRHILISSSTCRLSRSSSCSSGTSEAAACSLNRTVFSSDRRYSASSGMAPRASSTACSCCWSSARASSTTGRPTIPVVVLTPRTAMGATRPPTSTRRPGSRGCSARSREPRMLLGGNPGLPPPGAFAGPLEGCLRCPTS